MTSNHGSQPSISADEAVRDATYYWAGGLLADLTSILPGEPQQYAPEVRHAVGTNRVSVTHSGIPLRVDGEIVLNLALSYWMTVRSPHDHTLAVENSSFRLSLHGHAMPLFTLDYTRKSQKYVPISHFNIHAKRDDMVWAMNQAGRKRRGKRRQKNLEKGTRTPQFGDLHFPTGGARFRPALEDVLEFVINEFGIDVRENADASIQERRREWRASQLRAAIGDDLDTAITELEAQGFEVIGPRDKFQARRDRTDQY